MIKAVLFDLDGTLLDRDASLKVFIETQFERLREKFEHISKSDYIERFIELDCHGYVWKDQVYQQLLSEYEIMNITWQDLLEDYIQNFKHSCIPFPHTRKVLDDLTKRSLKLGIITNGYGQFQMDNINALDIYKYFQSILISEWEGMKKPNQLLFQKALKELNVHPNEAIYVGDHPVNDVEGAKKAGMTTIWVRTKGMQEIRPDFIIDGLEEIPAIIETLS